MAEASLMAVPELVFVDRTAGQGYATTTIIYEGDTYRNTRPMLWERINEDRWTPIDLAPPRILSSLSGDPERDGSFSQNLKPGQVYQVVMYYYEYIDPNDVDPTAASPEQKPDASVTVVALLKDPEEIDLITSEDQNVGGTWFRKIVMTRVPTFFVLQVSKDPPFKDAQGIDRFLAPLETVFDRNNTQHDRQVEPLLPGNHLHYQMRLIAEDGNWQIVTQEFRTKQRKVTIDFDVLHIINDGGENDNTAEFHIWVMEGTNEVRDYFFGDVDNFPITDRPGPGEKDQECIPLAPLCPTFVLGPKDITDDIYDVAILTRGLCYQLTEANDWAQNVGIGTPPATHIPEKAKFRFPTGDDETVHKVPLVLRTWRSVTDIEFEYDVTALFTVEYI